MKNQFVVLKVQRFKGEYEGRKFESTKIQCVSELLDGDDKKGLEIVEMKGAYDLFPFVKTVPGVYEVEFSFTKNACTFSGVEFKKSIDARQFVIS